MPPRGRRGGRRGARRGGGPWSDRAVGRDRVPTGLGVLAFHLRHRAAHAWRPLRRAHPAGRYEVWLRAEGGRWLGLRERERGRLQHARGERPVQSANPTRRRPRQPRRPPRRLLGIGLRGASRAASGPYASGGSGRAGLAKVGCSAEPSPPESHHSHLRRGDRCGRHLSPEPALRERVGIDRLLGLRPRFRGHPSLCRRAAAPPRR